MARSAAYMFDCLRPRRRITLILATIFTITGLVYVYSGWRVSDIETGFWRPSHYLPYKETAQIFMEKITTPSAQCPRNLNIQGQRKTSWDICLDSLGQLYVEGEKKEACTIDFLSQSIEDSTTKAEFENVLHGCKVYKHGIDYVDLGNIVEERIQLMKLNMDSKSDELLNELSATKLFTRVNQLLLHINLTNDNMDDIKVKVSRTFTVAFKLQPRAGLKVGDETRQLLKRITHIEGECDELKRVGNANDGGWTLCFDKKYGLWDTPCTVYSFGIANDWTFDKSLVDYGCELFAFDPSIGIEKRIIREGMWFYNIGLSDRNSDEYWGIGMGKYRGQKWKVKTLDGVRLYLGHTQRNIDVLKIDIEQTEWDALQNMLEMGTLQFVKQLVFEIHLWHRKKSGHRDELRLWNSILANLHDQGFRLVYVHKNPLSTAVNLGQGYEEEACCYELTMINTRYNDWWA
uniref:Methyltransferase-like protein 24-like n=1 Tax=Saccoglossus kowalevskii TaxID=10224 RepID=A0ABM0GS17_SACKO|nr:PREDICTED: methyltransferase-like protein 24-like [Saccoglossus kowalevskii]